MKQYVVDAFTEKVFSGNPAAVCVMDEWLPEELMMKIAIENNLSETAFAVREGEGWRLRWFTPGGEIDLCGHATLATAYVITRFVAPELTSVRFETLSGTLIVDKRGELLEMDFPAYDLKEVEVTDAMADAIGVRPVAAYMGRDLLCVLENEDEVRNFTPDMEKTKQLGGLLLHTTARGAIENADAGSNGNTGSDSSGSDSNTGSDSSGSDSAFDCVSRSYGPKLGVAEDPVCGSGHCHIIPYWAKALGKDTDTLVAYQASRRGGTLYCKMQGDRVKMSGKAALFSEGEIYF